MRLAVFTVSPKTENFGVLCPITPAKDTRNLRLLQVLLTQLLIQKNIENTIQVLLMTIFVINLKLLGCSLMNEWIPYHSHSQHLDIKLSSTKSLILSVT